MGNMQKIKQMSLNDSLDSRWNREERGWEERIWTAPTYVGILHTKLPRGAFISSLFNSPNSVWIFVLFFSPFHLKPRKYHLVYTHLPIKTSWTNGKHRQANCFTNTQHRSTQLHTSHLQSGSLYVNKDIFCSPGCFISPFVFPQECCMVSKHTPTHTLCACWNVHWIYSLVLDMTKHCRNFTKILAVEQCDEIPNTELQISPVCHEACTW